MPRGAVEHNNNRTCGTYEGEGIGPERLAGFRRQQFEEALVGQRSCHVDRWGCGDVDTWIRGDTWGIVDMWKGGDVGARRHVDTWICGYVGARGHVDTWIRGDVGARGKGDTWHTVLEPWTC